MSGVRDFARALLAFAETRTALAASELEEQALRLAEIVAWAAMAFFFLGAAVAFLAVLAVLLVREARPELVAGLIALAFLAAGLAGAVMARRRLRERPKFLEATLAELARDRARIAGEPRADA